MNEQNQILIYQTEDGQTQVYVRMENETVWLTQAQMAELFQTDRTSIVRHINNIYKVEELERESTCAKIAQVKMEDNRIALDFDSNLFEKIKPAFRYDGKESMESWQNRAYKRLWELLGLDRMEYASYNNIHSSNFRNNFGMLF